MRKETLFFLWGTITGLVLGGVIAFTIQYTQQSMRHVTSTVTPNRRSATPKTTIGTTAMSRRVQTRDNGVSNSVSSVASPSDGSVAIHMTSSCGVNFSATFVKFVRELKAAGEPPDLVVNLVVAEFNRQWRDEVNAVNRKLRSGAFDFEESQEFFHSRNDTLGETISVLLGDDSFVYWDKQRLLRSVNASSYVLTAAESNELYQIEKEHERRNIELARARDAGELDPLDYEEQRKKSDEQYQQERSQLVTEDRRVRAEDEQDNLLAGLKMQTRDLNPSSQQLAEMVDAVRKNLVTMEELESSGTKDAGYAEKLRVLEAASEGEWIRILGSQGYADFKKAIDYRYQTMKRYQELWRLSGSDLNYLYQTFAKYDKAIAEHNAQALRVPASADVEGKENPDAQIDNFAKDMSQQLEAELLRFLGEERFRRFKTAGLIPQVMPQNE